jgi:hypothetical protein
MGRIKDLAGDLPPLSSFARHNVTKLRFFCGGFPMLS